MSENVPTQANEEIDLGFLFEKIKSFFKSILVGLVRIIQFFWKHKFPLIGVGVVGIAVGLYMTKTSERIYLNELLVKPNYKSTQYLYDKVDAVNKKIRSNDSIFLLEVFGDDYRRVNSLEIEPIVDVYGLITESKEIQETFRVLFVENGNASFFDEDINKINYTNHKIKLLIKGKEDNAELTKQFYDYVNSNPFYKKKGSLIQDRLKEQREENKLILSQIDSVVAFVQKYPKPELSKEALSFTGSQDVSSLLDRKKIISMYDLELLERIATEGNVISLIDETNAVMDKSYNFSYRIVPFLFVGVYCLFFLFLYLRKKIIAML